MGHKPHRPLWRAGDELDERARARLSHWFDYVARRVVEEHLLRSEDLPLHIAPLFGDAPALDVRVHGAQLAQGDGPVGRCGDAAPIVLPA